MTSTMIRRAPVRKSITVNAAHAFEVFTAGIGR